MAKRKVNKKQLTLGSVLVIVLAAVVLLLDFLGVLPIGIFSEDEASYALGDFSFESIPEFNGQNAYIKLNGNKPYFDPAEYGAEAFEHYEELDSLGRCVYAMACVGKETMPTEERGDINNVTPSGWNQKRYDSELVEGGWLYNRCHLIGHQLAGEDDTKENLITGTRYLNIKGMLRFENQIADYINETGNHVLLRVTPIYNGNELVCRGVIMEAYSVEDGGEGICFNIYAYNVQPGIVIDYTDGSSVLED